MSTIISGQLDSENGASGAAITVTLSSTVSSSQGALLVVRSYPGASGIDATPPTPSGWTYAGGIASTAGSYVVREDSFYQRGIGTTPSVTFSAVTNVTRSAVLFAIDGVNRNAFVETSILQTAAANGGATTLSSTIPASAYTNALVIAAIGLGATFGGSGSTWNQGTAIVAGGQYGSHAVQMLGVAAPTAETMTASWTTAGNAALLTMFVGGDPGPTAVVVQNNAATIIDMSGSTPANGGALSYTITPSTNTSQPVSGLFVIARAAADQSFTITTSELGGNTTTSPITVPAADNIRRRSFDGSAWV